MKVLKSRRCRSSQHESLLDLHSTPLWMHFWIPYIHPSSISGLVVKSIVAIDGPRVRFTADAVSEPPCG
ncbi:hypothetical protein F5Y17DRAFT_130193 [Xylariaceae sp. FL0594]|nr:hypothetical protein F5Y17DRAFT_130193 [Xylariaceae sp. FL0594]